MELHEQPEEDPFAIAVHETGHLVVGLAFGRKIEKVSLDLIDDKRGCYWPKVGRHEWNDFDEVCTLLAGPRAQVELTPSSLPRESRMKFSEVIIHPITETGMIPDGFYDYAGWQHDIWLVYQRLCLPNAPAHNMPRGVTHLQVIQRAEVAVREFMREDLVQRETLKIAEGLLRERRFSGDVAEAAVKNSGLLAFAHQKQCFAWD